MPLPAWPVGLSHRSDVDKWSIVPFRAPLSTDMEGGNVRLRRRAGDDVATMKWGRDMTPAEMALFHPFVTATLLNGTSRFTMPVTLDGSNYTTRTVQMVADSLAYGALGAGHVAVSFSLLVFPIEVVA